MLLEFLDGASKLNEEIVYVIFGAKTTSNKQERTRYPRSCERRQQGEACTSKHIKRALAITSLPIGLIMMVLTFDRGSMKL